MCDICGEHDEPLPLEENGLWLMDNLELKSVGIDIGSAGTQVMFSRLKLRRLGEELSSRYVVVSREPLYISPVSLTPYVDGEMIDAAAVGRIVETAYAEAGLTPGEIDTGAVILTGEAIRRQNAAAIAQTLSDRGGQFVCVTAGHSMESVLAAYGSGAALRSYEEGCRILNVDIGGGTTKLAVVENGKVVQTSAFHIGGRLIALDDQNRITRLEPGARYIAGEVGLQLEPGAAVTGEQLDRMAEWMAEAVLAIISRRPVPEGIDRLHLTPPLEPDAAPAGMMFSGGVSEYVYGREDRDFGDLGRRLGLALQRRLAAGEAPWPLLSAGECMRATVIGASEHTVQVSGNTLYLSDPGLLPRRNMQVVDPACHFHGEVDPNHVAAHILRKLAFYDLTPTEANVALAFRWTGLPSYKRIAALAAGINQVMRPAGEQGKPLYLIFDGDIARTVGRLLKEELGYPAPVAAIDGVRLQEFDFIDLGRRLEPSGTVPVTVKSLIFQFARAADAKAAQFAANSGD